MLPTQTIEELISVSYVSAIIARSGFAPNSVTKDYGIDLEVRNIGEHNKKRIDLGTFLELQLKASINWSAEEESNTGGQVSLFACLPTTTSGKFERGVHRRAVGRARPRWIVGAI